MKERDLTLPLSIVDKKPPSLRTEDYSTEPLCNRLPLKAHLLRVPVFVWRGDQRMKHNPEPRAGGGKRREREQETHTHSLSVDRHTCS
ncbi:hypothetical protein JOQ06_023131 [Pogonophryne albipinna]|uniref:Uncharacterized protein n=1 Tax=Pogonophryne albipinna TaxID=1090488 RepID=A0AAD6BKL6_9TELE|nr:hypothetical protein JOQ06_023131 [Pogonophryne albipinna]